MTNTNNAEPGARINPKNGPALYEVSTLDGGTIIVKPTKVSREVLRVAEKVKDGTVLKARVTD
jgi:hypothetical protein